MWLVFPTSRCLVPRSVHGLFPSLQVLSRRSLSALIMAHSGGDTRARRREACVLPPIALNGVANTERIPDRPAAMVFFVDHAGDFRTFDARGKLIGGVARQLFRKRQFWVRREIDRRTIVSTVTLKHDF